MLDHLLRKRLISVLVITTILSLLGIVQDLKYVTVVTLSHKLKISHIFVRQTEKNRNAYVYHNRYLRYLAPSDRPENPYQSRAVLYEDGKPLPAPHAIHQDIDESGEGRYSLWQGTLIFSSSDNTDPRSNGRTYTIKYPPSLYNIPFIILFLSLLGLLFLWQMTRIITVIYCFKNEGLLPPTIRFLKGSYKGISMATAMIGSILIEAIHTLWKQIPLIILGEKSNYRMKRSDLYTLVFLGAVLFTSIYIRFNNLLHLGLWGWDANLYHYVGEYRWCAGLPENGYAKPGFNLLVYIVFRLSGAHDYSLPFMTSFLDCVNIILVFIIAKKIGARNLTALCSSVFYSFIPAIIFEARNGYPHIPSSTFLLLSFLMLLNFLKNFTDHEKNIYVYITLSGFFVTFSGQVHPSLLSLPILYYFIILFHSLKHSFNNEKIRRAALHSILFVFSIAAVFIFISTSMYLIAHDHEEFSIINNLSEMFNRFHVQNTVGETGPIYIKSDPFLMVKESYFNLTDKIIPRHKYLFPGYTRFLIWLSLLCFGLVLTIRYLKIVITSDKPKGNEKEYALILIWLMPLFLCASYAVFVSRPYARHLIPVVPYYALGTMVTLEYILDKLNIKRTGIFIVCISISFALYFVLGSVINKQWYNEPSFCRSVYNVLGNKPNINNKLLVTPVVAPVYLGWTLYYELGVAYHINYLKEWNEKPDATTLVSILRKNEFKFIVVSYTSLDPLNIPGYDIYENINEALKTVGAVNIYKTDNNPPPHRPTDLELNYSDAVYYGILEKVKWRKYIEIYEMPDK